MHIDLVHLAIKSLRDTYIIALLLMTQNANYVYKTWTCTLFYYECQENNPVMERRSAAKVGHNGGELTFAQGLFTNISY